MKEYMGDLIWGKVGKRFPFTSSMQGYDTKFMNERRAYFTLLAREINTHF